jgi:hypothetical protein
MLSPLRKLLIYGKTGLQYAELLGRGLRPELARVTVARKIAGCVARIADQV